MGGIMEGEMAYSNIIFTGYAGGRTGFPQAADRCSVCRYELQGGYKNSDYKYSVIVSIRQVLHR